MSSIAARLNRPPKIEPAALPCPFCGSPAEIEYWHGGAPTKRLLSCSNPDCWVDPSVTGETRQEAIDRWNARPTPAAEGG